MSRRCNGRSVAASLSCLHAVNGDDIQVAVAIPNNPGMLAAGAHTYRQASRHR